MNPIYQTRSQIWNTPKYFPHLSDSGEGSVISVTEMPIGYGGEDSRHSIIVEFVDGDYIEMTEAALRDLIATASWRAHGAQHYLQSVYHDNLQKKIYCARFSKNLAFTKTHRNHSLKNPEHHYSNY